MIKNSAALLTALAMAGIFWAIVVVARHLPDASPPDSDARPVLNQKLMSTVREEGHLNALEKTLDLVNGLRYSGLPKSQVLAVNTDQPGATTVAGKAVQPVKTSISLVYISPDMQKVVINGKMFGTGDTLPSGGRLISITDKSIVIMQHGRRKVVLLAKPQALGIASNSTDLH